MHGLNGLDIAFHIDFGGVMEKINCLIPDLPNAEDLLSQLKRIDENRWYSNFGPLVTEFEKGLELFMRPLSHDLPMHVCTTSSGTAAIEVAILAQNLPRQARILIPGLTFPGTINAIIQAECEPVISDIDENSWCLTPDIARDIYKYQPFDMVMPVATYGYPLDIVAWQEFHDETGIPVLIDAAGAFGCQRLGKGITIVFSMHATKVFGVGEGGCVVSSDRVFIDNVRGMTNFGFSESVIRKWGTNAKMSEYHAAIGIVQLGRWSEMRKTRQRIYSLYLSTLQAMDSKLKWQPFPDETLPSVFVVNSHLDGEYVAEKLKGMGIESRRWYCPPLNRHDAYTKYKTVARNGYPKLPVVEDVSRGLIGLPYHNFLLDEEIQRVCNALDEIGV